MKKITFINKWQPLFGVKNNIYIDGFTWNLTVISDSKNEYSGYNSKPDDFESFVFELENLLQKKFNPER